MTPEELKAARQALGLTQAQLGRLLDTDGQTIRRMEMPPEASTHRKVAVRMARLIQAYLEGYRPSDWPLAAKDFDTPEAETAHRALITAEELLEAIGERELSAQAADLRDGILDRCGIPETD